MTMLPLLVATVNPPCPRPWARRGDARPRMSELRVGRMCDRTIARGRGSGHTVCGMSTTGASYLFNQDREQERARLAGLSAQFDPVTVRHLATVGVAAGWHCLEVGAGAGSIARWLAAMVGSTGRVVATDLDTRFLDDLPHPPVEVVRHDIAGDPVEQDAFDLVHARAVLEHVPSRGEVVPRLAKALRPGGVLVLEDLVFGAALLPVSGRSSAHLRRRRHFPARFRLWRPGSAPPGRTPSSACSFPRRSRRPACVTSTRS